MQNTSKIELIPRQKALTTTKSWFSAITKVTVTASAVASILVKPVSAWLGPILGLLSQLAGEVVNRCGHDEKRDKIDKRIRRFNKLVGKLPLAQRSNFKLPDEITDKKVQGANPSSCSSSTTTILTVLAGTAAAALSIAMSETGENDWQSTTAIGLGVGTSVSVALRALSSFSEEHHKNAILDSHLDTLKFATRDVREQLGRNGATYNDIFSDLYLDEERKITNRQEINLPTLN